MEKGDLLPPFPTRDYNKKPLWEKIKKTIYTKLKVCC